MADNKRALLIVDVQNDFVEGGSLGVEGGLRVADDIVDYVNDCWRKYSLIVASRDWHNSGESNGGHFAAEGEAPDYVNTWPVHCVAGTHGADYVHEQMRDLVDIDIIKGMGKPAYSMFDGVASYDSTMTLDAWLRHVEVTEVDVCGIATDYCVRATVLDARRLGFEVRLLSTLHAGVATESMKAAIEEMLHAGATIGDV